MRFFFYQTNLESQTERKVFSFSAQITFPGCSRGWTSTRIFGFFQSACVMTRHAGKHDSLRTSWFTKYTLRRARKVWAHVHTEESWQNGHACCGVRKVVDIHVVSTIPARLRTKSKKKKDPEQSRALATSQAALSVKTWNKGVIWCQDVPQISVTHLDNAFRTPLPSSVHQSAVRPDWCPSVWCCRGLIASVMLSVTLTIGKLNLSCSKMVFPGDAPRKKDKIKTEQQNLFWCI